MTEGELVFLRLAEPVDARTILDWENNPDNWSVSDTKTPYALEDIHRLIETLQQPGDKKQMRWMICDLSTRRPIGAIDLFDCNYEEEIASVGILIANPTDRNQGRGLESLQLIEELADDLGIVRLNATIYTKNHPSLRLFQKAGYEKKNRPREPELKNADYIDVIYVEKWVEKF